MAFFIRFHFLRLLVKHITVNIGILIEIKCLLNSGRCIRLITCSFFTRTNFDAPEGNDAIAIDFTGMGRGEAWVNGQSIGRYHVRRSFIKPENNTLVLFEEMGGDPTQISLATKQIGSVCAHVLELHPGPVDGWNYSR
ncbi:putative beta-galactosidase [Dioscorea sansibarensis]